MPNKSEIQRFRRLLMDWFKNNKRDFPWRKEGLTNYEIIISEILLQRTKPEMVAKYFDHFIKQYPDWESLSKASYEDLEDILKPLGLYKHRAKRLYKIIKEYKKRGKMLPQNEDELRESSFSTLYLSNAFELFILNKRAPLLDVNMTRVLSRYFKLKEIKDVRNDKDLQNFSKKVTDTKNAKKINWAILDFAAKVCKPKKPDCGNCPLKTNCKFYNQAYETNTKLERAEEPQFNLYFDNNKKMLEPQRPLKLLSLFSGCGGMDIGFEGGFQVHKKSINKKHHPDFFDKEIDGKYVRVKPTKFQTIFANDILKPARDAWVNYFRKKGYSPEIFRLESIVELVKIHQQGIKVFPDHVDIVTGGFPCQDFSVSGKRSGFNSNKDHQGKLIKSTNPSIETRGKLYMWMKNVIDIVEPKIFVAENVKGLVNLSNVKQGIQQDFASANGDGYIVLPPKVLHAANYGVPQSRERVFFIGLKKSELRPGILEKLQKENIDPELSPYPEPTHFFDHHLNGFIEPVKLKDIFKGLVEPEETTDTSHMYYSKAKYMGKHCQGQTEINPEKIGPTIRAEHHGNIEFRRLSIENGGQNLGEINKGLNERRLTPRECALIQSFPPDFDCVIPKSGKKFIVSPSSAYKLIGNAVPPLLAYHLAQRIEKLWNTYFKE